VSIADDESCYGREEAEGSQLSVKSTDSLAQHILLERGLLDDE